MNKCFAIGVTTYLTHEWGGLLEEGIHKTLVELAMQQLYDTFYGSYLNSSQFIEIDGSPMIHGAQCLKMCLRNPSIFEEDIYESDLRDKVLRAFNIEHEHPDTSDGSEKVECLYCLDEADKTKAVIESIMALLTTLPYTPEIRQHMTYEGNTVKVELADYHTVKITLIGVKHSMRTERMIDHDFLERHARYENDTNTMSLQ